MNRRVSIDDSGRGAFIIVVLLAVMAAVLAVVYHAPEKPVESEPVKASKFLDLNVSEQETEAEKSWQILVSSAKRESEKDSAGYTVDFDAYHEYNDNAYGVLVLAWQQSEYEIDLYRYDEQKKVWTTSPRRENQIGIQIDTDSTTRQWNLPDDIIDKWVKEANDYMKTKYGGGKN